VVEDATHEPVLDLHGGGVMVGDDAGVDGATVAEPIREERLQCQILEGVMQARDAGLVEEVDAEIGGCQMDVHLGGLAQGGGTAVHDGGHQGVGAPDHA